MTETMKWRINPNLITDGRSFLDASTAVLINIFEVNNWERPIFFSFGSNPSLFGGLDQYLQLYGLAHKVLPFILKGTKHEINSEKSSEILLNEGNFKYFNDVGMHNMPRVSNILMNYYVVLYKLALYYKEQNQTDRVKEILEYTNKNLATDIFPQSKNIIKGIEELTNR
jgi:hypothetical protein